MVHKDKQQKLKLILSLSCFSLFGGGGGIGPLVSPTIYQLELIL